MLMSVIREYLESPSDHFAIQIDGRWGTGKTYFLRNKLRKTIEDSSFRYIYIPLNGLREASRIRQRIIASVIPEKLLSQEKASLIASGGKALLKWFGVDLGDIAEDLKIENALNLHKVCFCFDDLERSEVPIRELFGILSELIEIHQAKVIVVSNEAEIGLRDEELIFFRKAKEKVFSRTLKFVPKRTELFEQVLASPEFSEETKKVIRSCIGDSIGILRIRKNSNIRIIKRAIQLFDRLFRSVTSFNNRKPEMIWLFFLSLYQEFALGNHKLVAEFSRVKSTLELFVKVGLNKECLTTDFLKKYPNMVVEGGFLRSVVSFIQKGILNTGQLNAEFAVVQPKPKDLFEQANECIHLEADEFQRVTQEIIARIRTGEIPIEKFPGLISLLKFLVVKNGLDLDLPQLIIDGKKSLGKMMSLSNLNLDDPELDPILARENDPEVVDAVQWVNNAIVQERTKKVGNEAKVIEDTWFLDVEKFSEILGRGRSGRFMITPIFERFSAIRFLARFRGLPNESKNKVLSYLVHRYNFSPASKYFAVEQPFYRKLLSRCRAVALQLPKSIDRFYVERLSDGIEEIVKRITP